MSLFCSRVYVPNRNSSDLRMTILFVFDFRDFSHRRWNDSGRYRPDAGAEPFQTSGASFNASPPPPSSPPPPPPPEETHYASSHGGPSTQRSSKTDSNNEHSRRDTYEDESADTKYRHTNSTARDGPDPSEQAPEDSTFHNGSAEHPPKREKHDANAQPGPCDASTPSSQFTQPNSTRRDESSNSAPTQQATPAAQERTSEHSSQKKTSKSNETYIDER